MSFGPISLTIAFPDPIGVHYRTVFDTRATPPEPKVLAFRPDTERTEETIKVV